MIGYNDSLLQLSAELRVDGVSNVSVGFIGVLATGHYDEVLVACIDDLDVMYSQLMVEGDRNYGFHGAVIKKFSDLDICDLHNPVLRLHKDKYMGYIMHYTTAL